MQLLLLLLTCLLIVTPCSARVITVDDDGPADFSTIQAAIDDANDGDVVEVQPGRYPECINFLGKNITVTSTNPKDPAVVESTTIDWDTWLQEEAAVTFCGSEGPDCVLSGFNINGYIIGIDYNSDANCTQPCHATISHCVLRGNCGECGTVIELFDGLIANCLIAENNFCMCVCLCPVIDNCHGEIRGCTIVNNENGPGIGIWGGTLVVSNCIIHGNVSGHSWPIDIAYSGTVSVEYSLIQNGTEWSALGNDTHVINWGPGNIDTDPCFVKLGHWDSNGAPDDPFDDFWVTGDYHLKSQGWRWDTTRRTWTWDNTTSPCIDAGNPGSPLAQEPLTVPPDPNNTFGENLRINMGAYGGTKEASMAPKDWALLADLTNDGIVDFEDYAYQSRDWKNSGNELPGDLDRNDFVDMDDFSLWIEEWLRGTISLQDIPENVVFIPGGEYEMGDHYNLLPCCDEPVHTVWIDSFLMSQYEVTNREYCSFLNAAYAKGLVEVRDGGIVYKADGQEPYCDTYTADPNSRVYWDGTLFTVLSGKELHPMVQVSWYGAVAYCDFYGYRLPTEAEWECAARGGQYNPYFGFPTDANGKMLDMNYFESGDPYETGPYPWTTPVGYYGANGYRLFDMAGNVAELCKDWFDCGYYSVSPYNNPQGPLSGDFRIYRSGSWLVTPHHCRCAERWGLRPYARKNYVGFRVARDP